MASVASVHDGSGRRDAAGASGGGGGLRPPRVGRPGRLSGCEGEETGWNMVKRALPGIPDDQDRGTAKCNRLLCARPRPPPRLLSQIFSALQIQQNIVSPGSLSK